MSLPPSQQQQEQESSVDRYAVHATFVRIRGRMEPWHVCFTSYSDFESLIVGLSTRSLSDLDHEDAAHNAENVDLFPRPKTFRPHRVVDLEDVDREILDLFEVVLDSPELLALDDATHDYLLDAGVPANKLTKRSEDEERRRLEARTLAAVYRQQLGGIRNFSHAVQVTFARCNDDSQVEEEDGADDRRKKLVPWHVAITDSFTTETTTIGTSVEPGPTFDYEDLEFNSLKAGIFPRPSSRRPFLDRVFPAEDFDSQLRDFGYALWGKETWQTVAAVDRPTYNYLKKLYPVEVDILLVEDEVCESRDSTISEIYREKFNRRQDRQ